MSERLNLVCPKQYDWAFNKVKLNQAYSELVAQQRLNPELKITEDSIMENYIAHKGLLSDDQKRVIKQKRPRNTSNMDKNDQ